MGLLATLLAPSRQASAVPTFASAADDRWYEVGPSSLSTAGRRVSADTAMQVSAAYACVNLLSKTAASLPLRMYKTLPNAKNPLTYDTVEAPEHPLNDLLEYQPNKWQSAWDFKAMMMMHLSLRGNAYAEILEGPRGFADSLEPIHPDRVTKVERLADKTLRYTVLGPDGKQRVLLQDEVLHLRSAVAPGGLRGVSPVSYARETLGLALAAEEHGSRLFSNGARPSGVVSIKGSMGDAAFERFKAQWTEMYSGLNNAGKTPILEEGAEFKAISLTSEDAQFLSTREFQIEEVARWFDVPPVMLHHMTKASSWGTGVEAIMLAFVRNNLMPWLDCWTQAIRRDLILVPRIYEAKFDVEGLQRGDLRAQAEFYSRLSLAGILTSQRSPRGARIQPASGAR